jgi:predicted NUDIX family phosphoesterase
LYRVKNKGIAMNHTNQTTQHTVPRSNDELILVVKRADLFPHGAWQGLQQVDYHRYAQIIAEKKEFLPRSLMETDPTYKQIIPYLVFTYQHRYFLMQRQAKATETRLQSKYSLGIGGHLREDDIKDQDIISWAQREFHEEVDYAGSCKIESLGIINDDSNPVGQVHVGFVFLLHGTSPAIRVKEELKSGTLLTLEECTTLYDSMESWSQLILKTLCASKKSCC